MYAAPTTGRMLRDFGADVVKVEDPRRGDFARQWEPRHNGVALGFARLNSGKRSVGIDMRVRNLVEGKWNFEMPRRGKCPPWGIRGGTPGEPGGYLLKMPGERKFTDYALVPTYMNASPSARPGRVPRRRVPRSRAAISPSRTAVLAPIACFRRKAPPPARSKFTA